MNRTETGREEDYDERLDSWLILRHIAKLPAPTDDVTMTCKWCRASVGAWGDLEEEHEDTCPWLRARQWVVANPVDQPLVIDADGECVFVRRGLKGERLSPNFDNEEDLANWMAERNLVEARVVLVP